VGQTWCQSRHKEQQGVDYFMATQERKWNDDAPVIVCGVKQGLVTDDGTGVQKFANLIEARAVFPDLDPYKSSKKFTAALGDPAKHEMRFETWAANELYSR
jgi:hypothetical protein